MILGQCTVLDTLQAGDIIHYVVDSEDRYFLSDELVLALRNASEIFFCVLMHAVHNVPYHAVAVPLTIPPLQAHELGLINPDYISSGYFHNHAYLLAHAQYTDQDQLRTDLESHLSSILVLGFDSMVNWGVVGQASWPEFLAFFYRERVAEIVEERGMTRRELLTHYQVHDGQALSTFVAPSNLMVPYDPNYPALDGIVQPPSPSPPSTPDTFDSDFPLRNAESDDSDNALTDYSDTDIDLSDYSSPEDSDMTSMSDDEDTDTIMTSDKDDIDTDMSSSDGDNCGPGDDGPFMGPHQNDDDDDNGDGVSVRAVYGFAQDVDEVMEEPASSASILFGNEDTAASLKGHWLTIVCYNDGGNKVGQKSFELSELQAPVAS
ncbi:hypothetical protein EDD85DRAFT_793300 [Armillaria nabsnona]|nr:hypothetical protein EDD85DRAFT_793300 [Armillaria nabsnona]